MTKEIASYILKTLGYADYDITDIYESSFRAIRKNEWFLGELNVDLLTTEPQLLKCIDTDNVDILVKVVLHVLKRYK